MSEQWSTLMQQRITALYRYTRAMESEDAETISAVLYAAERDRVLERMILEANEGYQIEDRTVVHPDDIETVQHMLSAMMPIPPAASAPAKQKPAPTSSSTPQVLPARQARANILPFHKVPFKRWVRSRYSWLVAVAATLVILLSLPTTGVLADQFLALFRVQQFQPVTIDSQQSVDTLLTTMRNIGDIQSQRHSTSGDRQNLTQAEAEKLIGYHLLLPSHLPAGVSTVQNISVTGGDQVTYTFNANKARAYLAKNGQGSVSVPAQLDGASYTVVVAPSVHVSYSSCPAKKDGCQQEKAFFIHEVTGPSVQSNGKASITQLRDFLLSLPNISSSARELLKHIDEKSGTIPVPIPPQASAEQTTLRGNPGLLFVSNTMSAAIWETQGRVYTLALGTGDKSQLLDAVNSLT